MTSKTYTPEIIKNLRDAIATLIIKDAVLKVELDNNHLRLSKTVNHYLDLANKTGGDK